MVHYPKILIKDAIPFVAVDFPELDASLHEIVQMTKTYVGVRGPMLLSYVKDHCMNTQAVRENPVLEELITSGVLPLHVMEALFEASLNNIPFRNGLEDYIKCFLQKGKA